MTRFAAMVCCLAACQAKDGAKYMIGGGGGGGGGGGMGGVDAAIDGVGSGGDVVAGEVCLISDARQPGVCAATGAGGYLVQLDGHTAITNPDGTFIIDSPTSSNLTWTVTGTDLVTSLMGYSAVHRIPVIKQIDYLDLSNENSVVSTATFGDLFIHVTHMGTSEASVAATTTPVASFATLFDGNTSTTWTQIGTGPYGMVWVPGLAMGTVTATLTPMGGTATSVGAIPIGNQTITWVTLELP